MSSGKIFGMLFIGIVFLILVFLKIANFIEISDDATYLGILIYIGTISIISAMPREKD